jgi:hypothetical protein
MTCPLCDGPLSQPLRGRRRQTCSDACRAKLYRWRRDRAWLERAAKLDSYWHQGREARRRLDILQRIEEGS